MPKLAPPEDKPEAVKITTMTAGGMKEDHTNFSGGEPEEAIKHILLFHVIEKKMDIMKDHGL